MSIDASRNRFNGLPMDDHIIPDIVSERKSFTIYSILIEDKENGYPFQIPISRSSLVYL